MYEHKADRSGMGAERSNSILIIGNFLSGHIGTRSACEDLALQLQQQGWNVIWASNKPSKSLRLLDMLYSTWHHRHSYLVAQIDVFNGRAFLWAEATSCLLRQIHRPYVLMLRAGNMPEFARKNPRAVSKLLKSAGAVVTPSHYLAQELSFLGIEIKIIPNALNLGMYRFQERSKVRPRLVWLRAFHRDYNPLMAINAIHLLRADFPDIYLAMIGPDKGDGTLGAVRRAIERFGLQNNVTLHEAIPKSKVPDHLAEHDIFLNTTTAESFGVSVMEAAATGLCIVTTAVGELPFIWKNEQSALLIPPGDSGEMAQAIRRILTDPDLASRLSSGARATAKQYDWPSILPRWERLLIQVSQSGRRQSR